MSGLVVFLLLVYAVFALIANGAPILLIFGRVLGFNTGRLFETWLDCGILWIGCAYGLARWGDAARSMGSKNIPSFKVLFAPYCDLLGIPIQSVGALASSVAIAAVAINRQRDSDVHLHRPLRRDYARHWGLIRPGAATSRSVNIAFHLLV